MENVMSIFENADPFRTWWPTIAAIVVGALIVVRTAMSGQRCPNDNQIKEQIVIVTGASGGIGFEIAKALAARGGRVILACRNMTAAERAAAVIKRELGCRVVGSAPEFFVEPRYLDLRSFDSVHRFARLIASEFECVDVLVNNAGVIFGPVGALTVDGFDEHLQVNFLSHFLLTQLLLPHLRRSRCGGRVVNVSAHAHAAAKIDSDDPLNVGTWAVKFHARDAFAHSKLAVLLATRWLARELNDSTITVNCCTPGLVRGTAHLRNSPLMSAISVKLMTYPWMWLFMKNPVEGAQCAIRLATDPQLKNVTGEYFNDCEIALSSEAGRNEELAEKLCMQTVEVLRRVTKLNIDKETENEIQVEMEKATTTTTTTIAAMAKTTQYMKMEKYEAKQSQTPETK